MLLASEPTQPTHDFSYMFINGKRQQMLYVVFSYVVLFRFHDAVMHRNGVVLCVCSCYNRKVSAVFIDITLEI